MAQAKIIAVLKINNISGTSKNNSSVENNYDGASKNNGSVKKPFFLWCRNSVEDVKNRYEACKQVRDIEMQGHTTGKKNKVDSMENTGMADLST